MKEVWYSELEEKFIEVIIYDRSIVNPGNPWEDIHELQKKNKEEIEKSSTLYSTFKIDLLTLALAPEHHDLVLSDPYVNYLQKGRINYQVKSNQWNNISIQVQKADLKFNSLINNELSLKLKFKNHNNKHFDTAYTSAMKAKMIPKNEETVYNYTSFDDDECVEDSVLTVSHTMSINDLRNSDASINIYSTKLVDTTNETNINKTNNISKANTVYLPQNKILSKLTLSPSYTIYGFMKLNFIQILNEHDNYVLKQTSKFFQSMSNKKNEECYSPKKKIKQEIQFTNTPTKLYVRSFDQENEEQEEFEFRVFENISQEFSDIISWKGVEIGKLTLTIKITNVPLIQQVICGVLTETGFEINSLFMYDNTLLSSNETTDLPDDLILLIQLKTKFDNEITSQAQHKLSTNSAKTPITNTSNTTNFKLIKYLYGIKDCLERSIEENCLYYGYSNNQDLYKGQLVMLELGWQILEIIDKLNIEQRKTCFNILLLIHNRSEFDLCTVTIKWFKDTKNKKDNEFMDDIWIKNKIIESFLRFNNECLRMCIEGLKKGRNLDNESKEFLRVYSSIAYFRIPIYREAFLKSILHNISKPIGNISWNNKQTYSNDINTKSIEDLIAIDPINNWILWENLFYKKLTSSLLNTAIPNDINEAWEEMNEIVNKKNVNGENDWKTRFYKREFIFFDTIKYWNNRVIKKVGKRYLINWWNIPGYNNIILAIHYELTHKPIAQYPMQLMKIIPDFVNNVSIINNMLKLIIPWTNAYDTYAVFNILHLINSIFEENEKNIKLNTNQNSKYFENKFDYNLVFSAFKVIISTENTLGIAKFWWLYYSNWHLIPLIHVLEIVNFILLPKFFNFFFNWSWSVRNTFYYWIWFIFGYRWKDIWPKWENNTSGTYFYRWQSQKFILNGNKTGEFCNYYDTSHNNSNNNNPNNHMNKSNKKVSITNSKSGDLFDEKLQTIRYLQNIIYTEELDPSFNNKIDENKYKKIWGNIPDEYRSNIVECMKHFDDVMGLYTEWKSAVKKGWNDMHEYPDIQISPPKDDVVEYNEEY